MVGTFGFADVGFEFVTPLEFMPSGCGVWTVRAGPHLIWLGNHPARIGSGVTGGDHFAVWGKIGVSVGF